ncbi:MAG: response regulator [Chloroflexales bacterium]|nr:response regulator [Chloroflexales bacterium]
MAANNPSPSSSSSKAERLPVVLVADDNDDNLSLCVDYLEARGYALVTARTGREAVDLAIEQHPDAILMDILMPDLDGLEAMRRIRTNTALARTPIVALTALARDCDREQCMAAGASAFLSKPVSMRELARLLTQLIDDEAPG